MSFTERRLSHTGRRGWIGSNLRSGAGPVVVAMWVWAYDVQPAQTLASQATDDGHLAWSVGLHKGGFTAAVYTGCQCSSEVAAACEPYRELQSWKAVRANAPHRSDSAPQRGAIPPPV